MANCPLYILIYTISSVWASLVAQLVKNLPGVQETRVRFLGWEDPLEKEMAIHSSTLVTLFVPRPRAGRWRQQACGRAGASAQSALFRMDWLDLLAVQGTLKSLLQHHRSKASQGRRGLTGRCG